MINFDTTVMSRVLDRNFRSNMDGTMGVFKKKERKVMLLEGLFFMDFG
jgi:hypothetical protein